MQKTRERHTALHFATENGDFESVPLLIQNGAEINAKDNQQATPLHFAVRSGNYEVVDLLLKNGARKELKNNANLTPLQCAEMSQHEDFKKIYTLLLQDE